MLTHWKKLNNPDYLGAYAFDRGEEKIVTIKNVTRETVTGAEGKKSDETVVHFTQDVKPLILNSTNAKMIEKILKTPYIEEWAGGNLVLVVREVRAFGELVDAVRVKMERIMDVCEICGQQVEAAAGMDGKAVALYTRQKYGKVLCAACAANMKGAKHGGKSVQDSN